MGKPGILFDMDGVLVDSEPVITAAAVEGLKLFGIPAKPEDFKPFTGMGEDAFIGNVAQKYGARYIPEMKDAVYGIYGQKVDAELVVYEGMKATLTELSRRGFSMALASSADRVKVDHNLRVAGLDSAIFSAILSGSDVTLKKPYPEIYIKAAEALMKSPDDCIVVEDALSGVLAGVRAGARVIGLATAFSKEELLAEGASWVFETVAEILPLLVSIT